LADNNNQHLVQAQVLQRDHTAGCVSGRMGLGDDILRTLWVYLQPLWHNLPADFLQAKCDFT